MRSLLPVSALLLGSALLLFAGGVNGLILPVMGSEQGFSALSLGLLGTGWAVGYVAGCLAMPVLVSKIGHIRAFAVVSAFAGVAILLSYLLLMPAAWIPLRALSGFCFAGAAMIVESWLNDRTEPGARGKVFGAYTMVNLVASTMGQMALTAGPTDGPLFFMLGGIFYCLALVPVAVSTSSSPQPLTTVSLDVKGLWKNSPIAVFGVFMTGISNSAFGTLSAVYADRVGLVLTTIALFASLPILLGAAAQIPVGILSDRMDRRKVLIGLAVVALGADLAFILLAPEGRVANLALAGLFGASVYAMYPVIVAHANDHAPPGSSIQVSGGLLMVFGLGAIFGPLAAGVLMGQTGPTGLFLTSALVHALIIGFAAWRISVRPPVAASEKSSFQIAVPSRAGTPETAVLAGPAE